MKMFLIIQSQIIIDILLKIINLISTKMNLNLLIFLIYLLGKMEINLLFLFSR